MYKTGHNISHDFTQSSSVTCTDCGEVFSADDPHTLEELREGLCITQRSSTTYVNLKDVAGRVVGRKPIRS